VDPYGRVVVPWMDFLVMALAVWRVSCMLVREDGPVWVFGKFRKAMGVRYDAYGNPYGDSWWSQLFTCIYCMSVWIGIMCTLFWIAFPRFTVFASLPLAFSAMAVLLTATLDFGGVTVHSGNGGVDE